MHRFKVDRAQQDSMVPKTARQSRDAIPPDRTASYLRRLYEEEDRLALQDMLLFMLARAHTRPETFNKYGKAVGITLNTFNVKNTPNIVVHQYDVSHSDPYSISESH